MADRWAKVDSNFVISGAGAAASWGATEYIPIVTLSMNNWSKPPRYHLNDYFYNTGNQFDQGFITRSVTEIRRNYQRIQGFVEEMGWQ